LLLAQTTSAGRSVQPVSSGRASSPWSTRPASTPRRRSPMSSRRCPPIRFRRPGSGCPAVRCPVTWGRRPAGPAVGRLLSTRPASSRLLSAPVRPDTSVSSMLRRWCWGPGRAGRATLTTRTGGGGPCGCRARRRLDDGRGGRDACNPVDVALVRGRSVADPARRVGCGRWRPRLPTERPGRPGRRTESARRGRLRGGHGSGLQREVAAPDAWLPSSAGCATTVCGRRRA
jgi:hypothetical protein